MLEKIVKTSLHCYSRRIFVTRQTTLHNCWFKSSRNASSENQDLDNDMNKPLQYSTSEAAVWRAEKSRNPAIDRHPQENNVVVISVTIFLIYFFILREENDIDIKLGRDLEHVFKDMNKEPPPSPSNSI